MKKVFLSFMMLFAVASATVVASAPAASDAADAPALTCPTQTQAIEQLSVLLGVSVSSINTAISEAKITVDALACGWRFTAENGTYWGDLFKVSGGGGSGTVTQIDIVDPW